MNPQATVIIPTYNDWSGLQTCLDCLAGQTAKAELFEVIVANNNPSPDLPDFVRFPSNARVVHVPKPGSYAARNAALGAARGDVLFFTDSDCLPDSRWIEAGLVAIAPLGPHARIAGRIDVVPDAEEWTGIELYDRVHYLLQEDFVRSGWCATANLVTRRSVFDHVGLFNEDRFSGGDKEWNCLATELGCEIHYGREVMVRHPARASFAELAKKRRRLVGGYHHDVDQGRIPRRPLRHHLRLMTYREMQKTMLFPGLTDVQRLQVMWVCFRLGMVAFAEVARLRYLSGKPNRS